MTRAIFTWNRAALAAVTVCLMSVLDLLNVSYWTMLFSGLILGIVWTIAEIVVEEIQGRRKMRRDSRP